ncbi:class I SAM-dependent methyltransferase [Gracilibacillus caseinilyticus]|uniref:Class I SAM-dependent methyltransferase n=1 Tax=Gracilibacillus caseinilyticus TaxID=2932256 RepID=A0ABY4F7B3_9BACI|nr:class I SAM-dependent methyltransferase [Gracilibacillus caseinilyticus]UOQ50336.1 class I SAM-dependent methyltransferase [Gracilibacillus caseinilyticus]
MKLYYSDRAKEYERVYFRDDPIRQQGQINIQGTMKEFFKNRNVLEIACGTGYWTQFVQQEAEHITAIDFSPEVLSIAKEKDIPSNKVTFLRGDAYNLESITGNFDAGLANFWFSHIPKARIQEFLKQLHFKLGEGSRIFMADNVYIRALGGTLIKKENDENTYKIRTLENGSKYEIIKNYYTETELRNIFGPYSNDLEVHYGQCFWWISYTTR